MAIYKRGRVYWYKFMWNNELVRESTKQGNDRKARNMEADRRAGLAREQAEREAAKKQLGCERVARCAECGKWFDEARASSACSAQASARATGSTGTKGLPHSHSLSNGSSSRGHVLSSRCVLPKLGRAGTGRA